MLNQHTLIHPLAHSHTLLLTDERTEENAEGAGAHGDRQAETGSNVVASSPAG